MQPFTIDDVPDVITPRWWQEHQHLLELGRDCVMRVRKGATVPRRTPGPAP